MKNYNHFSVTFPGSSLRACFKAEYQFDLSQKTLKCVTWASDTGKPKDESLVSISKNYWADSQGKRNSLDSIFNFFGVCTKVYITPKDRQAYFHTISKAFAASCTVASREYGDQVKTISISFLKLPKNTYNEIVNFCRITNIEITQHEYDPDCCTFSFPAEKYLQVPEGFSLVPR